MFDQVGNKYTQPAVTLSTF